MYSKKWLENFNEVDKILQIRMSTIEDSGKHIKHVVIPKYKRIRNGKEIKRCISTSKECVFKDYSNLKDCADRIKVKCKIIDYSALPRGYMEVK